MCIAMQCVKEFLVVASLLQLVASYPFAEESIEANQAPKLLQFANNKGYTQNEATNPNRQDIDLHTAQPRPTYEHFGTSYTTNKEGDISKETQFSRTGHLRQNADRTEYKNLELIQHPRRDNEYLLNNQPTSIPDLKQQVQQSLDLSIRGQISNPNRGITQNYPTVAEPVLNSVSIQNPFDQVNKFEKVRQIYPTRQQYHPLEQGLPLSPPIIGSINPGLPNAYNSRLLEPKQSPIPGNNNYDQFMFPNTAMINHKVQNTPHGHNLKDLMATNPAIKNVLESTKHQKRYLVIHPNGEVEHVDELQTIVDKHPNYILVNGGTIDTQEAKAPAEIKPDFDSQLVISKALKTEEPNVNPDVSYETAAVSQKTVPPEETVKSETVTETTISAKSIETVSPYTCNDSFGTEIYTVIPHETVESQNSDITETASNTDITSTATGTPINLTKQETINTETENKTPKTVALPTSETPPETSTPKECATGVETDSTLEPFLQKYDTPHNTGISINKPLETKFRYEITSSPQTLAILKALRTLNKPKVQSDNKNTVLPETVAKQETEHTITTKALPDSTVLYNVVSPPETLAVFADHQKDSTSEAAVPIDTTPQDESVLPLTTNIPSNRVASSDTASPVRNKAFPLSNPPQTPDTLTVAASEYDTILNHANSQLSLSTPPANEIEPFEAIVNDNSSQSKTSTTSTKAAASTSSDVRLSCECEKVPQASSTLDTPSESVVSSEETSAIFVTSSETVIPDSNTDCESLTTVVSTSNSDSSANATKSSVKNIQSNYKAIDSKENINSNNSDAPTKPIIFRTTESEFWDELLGDEPEKPLQHEIDKNGEKLGI